MKRRSVRQRVVSKTTIKPSLRQLAWVSSGLMVLLILGWFGFLNQSEETLGAVSGDYRSKTSGYWNNSSTWEKFDGTNWVASGNTPNDGDKAITIRSGHTVTVNNGLNADELTVEADAQLVVAVNRLTVKDGTGDDLTVNGTLTITSELKLDNNALSRISGLGVLSATGILTLSSGCKMNVDGPGIFRRDGGTMPTTTGYWIVNSGGTFQHNMNAGTLPLATWNTGGICEVSGTTSNLPGNIGQTFQNFNINFQGLTAPLNFGAVLTQIGGDFKIISTGTSHILFDQQGNNNTLTIGGNMYVQGGTSYGCLNGATNFTIAKNYIQTGGFFSSNMAGGTAYGNTSSTLNVGGNVTVTGGTYDMTQCTANNAGIGTGTLNLGGNLNVVAPGLITETQSSYGAIYFAGTGIQTCIINNITNTINYIVNSGVTLRMDQEILTGSGTFTLMSGGKLMIGDANGITNTGASGNIQVTGTRSYSTGADYTYNGIAAQNTGNGLPATVRNLTFDNSNNVTMTSSSSATGIVTITNGKIITSSNVLGTTNTSTSSVTGYTSSNYIVGNLRRSTLSSGTYDFPLGTMSNYELATLTLNNTTGFTSILGSFTNANPISALLPLTGLLSGVISITDMLDYGYWTLSPNSAMTSGTYNVTLTEKGFSNPSSNNESYCVLKRSNALSLWQLLGTHVSSLATASGVSATRSGFTSFSQFGIGKVGGGGGALPIELINFIVKQKSNSIDISWSTAAEKNNDYFTIERSAEEHAFSEIEKIDGAGNSNSVLNYRTSDPNPLPGKSYYRLKQTDFNGAFTYSPVRVINRDESSSVSQESLLIKSVAPNPFNQRFSITYNVEMACEVEIMLTGMNGQVMHNEKVQAEPGVNYYDYTDEKNIPMGNYIITLLNSDKKTSRKIIKSNK